MQVVKIVKRDEEATATSAPKAVFVLAHGSWHNHSAWDKITPILEAGGFAALTLDLPGAGVHAIAPASLDLRPFDPAAFAAERSPVAGVTQEERTQAVVALVKEAAPVSDGKGIPVGHSAGGMTISAVAEQVPYFSQSHILPGSWCRTACRCSRCSSMKPCLRLWRLGCSWVTRRHRRDKDQCRIDRRSLQIAALRFMATCRTQTSRMRRRSFIATNQTPASWLRRKLRLEDLARCRAITSAAHKTA